MAEISYMHGPSVPLTSAYLWDPVLRILEQEERRLGRRPRVLDLGCGVGHFAQDLKRRGYDVVGVAPSPSARVRCRDAGHDFRFEAGGDTPESIAGLGSFDVVCSLEVIEHVYSPRAYVECLTSACQRGGLVILSTPYHGYWKNLTIALLGGFDRHFTALWEGGHIKFWSVKTLGSLLRTHGLKTESVDRVGRLFPALAKSMVVAARYP